MKARQMGSGGRSNMDGRRGATSPFQWDRGRARRRFFIAFTGVCVFAGCLAQVWLTTRVAQSTGRITRLADEVHATEIDLSIARADLSQRRLFSELHDPARRAGFARQGHLEEVTLAPAPSPGAPVVEQLAADLVRGSFRLMTEARAQDRPEVSGRRATAR